MKNQVIWKTVVFQIDTKHTPPDRVRTQNKLNPALLQREALYI